MTEEQQQLPCWHCGALTTEGSHRHGVPICDRQCRDQIDAANAVRIPPYAVVARCLAEVAPSLQKRWAAVAGTHWLVPARIATRLGAHLECIGAGDGDSDSDDDGGKGTKRRADDMLEPPRPPALRAASASAARRFSWAGLPAELQLMIWQYMALDEQLLMLPRTIRAEQMIVRNLGRAFTESGKTEMVLWVELADRAVAWPMPRVYAALGVALMYRRVQLYNHLCHALVMDHWYRALRVPDGGMPLLVDYYALLSTTTKVYMLGARVFNNPRGIITAPEVDALDMYAALALAMHNLKFGLPVPVTNIRVKMSRVTQLVRKYQLALSAVEQYMMRNAYQTLTAQISATVERGFDQHRGIYYTLPPLGMLIKLWPHAFDAAERAAALQPHTEPLLPAAAPSSSTLAAAAAAASPTSSTLTASSAASRYSPPTPYTDMYGVDAQIRAPRIAIQ